MNWEKTVMEPEELRKINNAMPSDAKYGDVFLEIARTQAGISFKAGSKLVVEWMKEHSHLERHNPDTMDYFCDYYSIFADEWQDQKKEWGL